MRKKRFLKQLQKTSIIRQVRPKIYKVYKSLNHKQRLNQTFISLQFSLFLNTTQFRLISLSGFWFLWNDDFSSLFFRLVFCLFIAISCILQLSAANEQCPELLSLSQIFLTRLATKNDTIQVLVLLSLPSLLQTL